MLRDVFWSATQHGSCLIFLQQLTSTDFCVQSVLGEREHIPYPNLKLFLDIRKLLLLLLLGDHQNVSELYSKR